jgi:predicted ATPase
VIGDPPQGRLSAAGTYQFAHDMIREVVEADLGAARRTLLHRRIAAALERMPGEPAVEALAYHYARSEDRAKAILFLERAGDKAWAQAAPAAAADYYRALVECLNLGHGESRMVQSAARGDPTVALV